MFKYFADTFVKEKVLVELKTAKEGNAADEARLMNELKATRIRVELRIDF
ncbi:GxxExxY protein [Rubripirellula tenax]|nr:GxxExxY protein [Rubripirellula tenax]